MKVKRTAEAARAAALGLAHRVRSRELLAKLGDAHIHLEAARNHLTSGDRQIVMLCLELAKRCVIEAQEISRSVQSSSDLERVSVLLARLIERVARMRDPLPNDDGFVQLRLLLAGVAQLLERSIAQSRYAYEMPVV